MSKDDFVTYLKDHGYNTELKDGVVMVITEKPSTAQEINELNNLVKSAGYGASWGVKCQGQTRNAHGKVN